MKPPVVISVHGIRTRGEWQKTLAEALSEQAIPIKSVDYGYYRFDQMIRPWLNEGLLDRFFGEYQSVLDKYQNTLSSDDPSRRPSIIAHSMGTFIVGYAMQKYEEIKFDKIIMCGGILPVDFDWDTLFDRDQVNLVRNEYGLRDLPSKLAARAIRGAGPSGRYGFRYLSNRLDEQQYPRYRHSDFFKLLHIRKAWLPFLEKTPPLYGVKHGRDINSVEELCAITDRTAVIDDTVYGSHPSYKDVQIIDNMHVGWVEVNPDIYTFLYDRTTGEYCGYINALPLTDEALTQVKLGKMRDNELPPKAVVPYIGSNSLKIYLMSVAIDPRKPRLGQGLHSVELETLLRAFLAKLSYYARHAKIRVTEVVAVGWTTSGQRICEQLFSMEKVGEDEFSNPVYSLRIDESLKSQKNLYPPLRRLVRDYNDLINI